MNYVEYFNLFGVDAKQIPSIRGAGAPTESTEGAVGCFYMNTVNGDLYKCIADENDKYEWSFVGSDLYIIMPQNYGAKADGVTDDTAAIQAAFDACHEAGGGTVYLPCGTYLLSDAVKFYSNMHIVGDGAVLLQKDGNVGKSGTKYCNLMRNYNEGIGGYENTENVVIEGITFDGGTQEISPTTILCFCHSRNITIRNCMFTNGYNDTENPAHDIECNSSKGVLIEKCRFVENRHVTRNAELIQIDAIDLKVRYPWLPDNGAAGAFDSTACEDITINGCSFVGHHGIGDADVNSVGNVFIGNHTTIKSINIRICNNVFKTGVQCIRFRGAKNLIIADNIVEDVVGGFGLLDTDADDESYLLNTLVVGEAANPFASTCFVQRGNIVNRTLTAEDIGIASLPDGDEVSY